MAPSRKSVNQIMVDFVTPKRKGEVIEAAEPTDRRPTLSEVYISDAEDSHPSTTLPHRKQTAEPKPPLNGGRLLQVLSSMRK